MIQKAQLLLMRSSLGEVAEGQREVAAGVQLGLDRLRGLVSTHQCNI